MINKNKNLTKIEAVTLKLLSYCHENGWKGYDPYDALNSRVFTHLPFLDFSLFRLFLTQMLKRNPFNLRQLLRVPKTLNAKAIALFLMAIIKLSRLGLVDDDDLIRIMTEKLEALRSENHEYWCWGYSFPWQTRTILVPRAAPNLVCTVFVSNALLDAYKWNREERYLSMATSAAEYILNELYWSKNNFIASLSYPHPGSRTPIHNANFLGAAVLCRTSKYSGEKKFLEPAVNVARYSAAKQNKEGSWYYGESSKQRWVDNFHTGYNLTSLKYICEYTKSLEFEGNIRRGFEFYRTHFFREDGAAKYFHDRTYPIDIHSVAQSIITLILLRDLDENSLSLARHILSWTLAHMWDDRGYFYYRILPFCKIKTSYMRWSQAWMLYSLSTFLERYPEKATE